MYKFTAVVQQSSGGSCTASKTSVVQRHPDNTSSVVAYIHDSLDCGDLRTTTIDYAEGRLCFSDNYDLPLQVHRESPFSHGAGRPGGDIALHSFFRTNQTYISADSGFYPVKTEQNGVDYKITVYDTVPIFEADGVRYPVLAVIEKTNACGNGFEYEIQTGKLPPLALLAVIFSLPFTLGLVM